MHLPLGVELNEKYPYGGGAEKKFGRGTLKHVHVGAGLNVDMPKCPALIHQSDVRIFTCQILTHVVHAKLMLTIFFSIFPSLKFQCMLSYSKHNVPLLHGIS